MARLIATNNRLAVRDGRLVTDAGGAPCCCGDGGGPQPCRYYPAVLCSTWVCEPPVMAQILPGAGVVLWICVCPPTQAPVGLVFRIQTRCYRITGAGVERSAVPDADWLYDCRGVLSPPVGSPLAASEHRLISEPACGQGSCAVNLCGKYVRLTPCGNVPGCARPVYARADQYAYGRAVAVLCSGQTPAITACYCAEATPNVLLLAQLPANAILWNFPATLEGCCDCAESRGSPCCRERISLDYSRRNEFGFPGATGREVACCCNFTTGSPSIAGEFTWGDFSLRIVQPTVIARDRCAVTWRGFIDWTGRGASVGDPPVPGPIRSGRLGPYEWTLRCGGVIDTPPTQSNDLIRDLRTEGILDFLRQYDPWHLPLLFARTSTVSAIQECGRARVAFTGTENGSAYTGFIDLSVAADNTEQCEGCGSGQGSGDVGDLIP